jgi:ABC-2 type transport system permease protein
VLIIGKVLAVFCVGIIQALVLLVAVVLVGLLFPGLFGASAGAAGAPAGDVPALDLGGEVLIDPVRIALAAGLFVAGFLLFTGLLVAIGSVMPTAKDAGSAFGAVILAMFLPLYTATAVLNDPGSPVSEVLTWFPLTAPVTALLRNALGLMPVWQGIGVILVLALCAAALLWLGVRLFRQGSISYDKRLSIGKALRPSRD